MAEVFLARRRAAGIEKWLVVKRMRPETSGDPRFLDLFVREARLSMSLVHQNIVPVFDFGRIDDQVFLAMERVEGKDLGSSLAHGAAHRMPSVLAAFIAAECCQALDYAHQRKSPDGVALGIVHRDVTPRNVLLSWSGEVKLTDFGIAALAGDATSRLLGTPHYMAPEQARSEPIDPRADIYAIGLVLREAISGVRPRPGSDRDTILDAARRGELLPWPHLARAAGGGPPPEPEQIALGSGDHTEEPAPPAALVAIVDRATARDPAERYPDARSMLADLDSFIVGERAANRGESPARQLAAWLAVVWEGARDDLEADASIEGNHLVSFLDDGAIDVIGTGTVRSLAATAAEDVPAPAQVDVPALRAAAESPLRPGHVSSSHVTVASGAFNSVGPDDPPAVKVKPAASEAAKPAPIPATAKIARRADDGEPRPSRWSLPVIASIVFAGVAAAAVVYAVGEHARGADKPVPPVPPVPPVTAPVVVAPADAAAAQQAVDAGELVAIPVDAGVAVVASAPDAGAVLAPPSRPREHNPHRPDPGHAAPAPAPAVAEAHKPSCRVRINFTPWAFYTADEDATRHETPSTVELSPGRHKLHVWNPELHVERDITLTVPGDRDAMNYSEPLQSSTLPDPAH
jgi:hypothetical protein